VPDQQVVEIIKEIGTFGRVTDSERGLIVERAEVCRVPEILS
jgi:hypothetical protein